jgi:hypothetical protein
VRIRVHAGQLPSVAAVAATAMPRHPDGK